MYEVPLVGVFSVVSVLVVSSYFLVRIRGDMGWFYFYLVVFFTLGVFLKPIAQYFIENEWLEPIGNFDFSLESWFHYWITSLMFILAMVSARLLSVYFSNRRGWCKVIVLRGFSKGAWFLVGFLISLFYILNFKYAFFVTGVNPVVQLPFGLSAHFAFMLKFGFPALLVFLFGYDVLQMRRIRGYQLFVMLLISILISFSTASRIALLLIWVPVLISIFYIRKDLFIKFKLSHVVAIFLFFVASLIFVSLYRIELYGIDGDNVYVNYLYETLSMILNRWIGAEAIMVATGEQQASISFFLAMLRESSSNGVDALYQVASGGKYTLDENNTFLTLPGYYGVVAMSDSLLIVYLVTFLLTCLGIYFEKILMRLFKNEIFSSFVSFNLANALCQLSFPGLTGIFILYSFFLLLLLYFCLNLWRVSNG